MSIEKQPPPKELGWTAGQRRALVLLLFLLLAALSVRYGLNRAYVSDPRPSRGTRSAELESRVDPNTADWQTLAAIPTLGEKRAKEIVACRQRALKENPHSMVFQTAEDLAQVRGIGPATVQNLRPYLEFPTQATKPSP